MFLARRMRLSLTLKLPFLGVPVKDLLIEGVRKKLSDLDNSVGVQVNIEQMSQEERDRFCENGQRRMELLTGNSTSQTGVSARELELYFGPQHLGMVGNFQHYPEGAG